MSFDFELLVYFYFVSLILALAITDDSTRRDLLRFLIDVLLVRFNSYGFAHP